MSKKKLPHQKLKNGIAVFGKADPHHAPPTRPVQTFVPPTRPPDGVLEQALHTVARWLVRTAYDAASGDAGPGCDKLPTVHAVGEYLTETVLPKFETDVLTTAVNKVLEAGKKF